jgi:hypothetical protein
MQESYSFEFCVKMHKKPTAMFKRYAGFCDDMTLHILSLILTTPFKMGRAHCFSYLACCVDFVRTSSTEFEDLVIPDAGANDVEILQDRIRAQKWDICAIQSILFDNPLLYSYEQIWELATVIMEHRLADSEQRSLAFFMGTHERVGANFPLSQLDSSTLRRIMEMSLRF